MPIEYRIDHENQLVTARATGILAGADFFAYQREVWSRPDVAGYDELVDMTAMERVADPSTPRMRELAAFSSAMDPRRGESKFAIVAPQDIAFGLGRMYETYRELNNASTKTVEVFRTLTEALAFLGIEAGYEPWADDVK